MLEVTPYRAEYKETWDRFADQYSVFMHKREFVEYHADRFQDASIMLWKKSELVGIFPAHESGQSWESHSGLSFGGLSTLPMNTPQYIDCWRLLLDYAAGRRYGRLLYKPTPPYMLGQWTDRAGLILHWLKARLLQVENNSIVSEGDNPALWSSRRKRGVKKAEKAGLRVQLSQDWEGFWELLAENLKNRYGRKPVHTLAEILYLKRHFPNHIRLYTVITPSDELLGGTVLWQYPAATHAQYIGSNPLGRELGAMDALFSFLFQKYKQTPIFSLGVSSLRESGQINAGLQAWKESWGAQSWPHYTYAIEVANRGLIEGRLR